MTEGNVDNKKSLIDLFKALKSNVFETLNVAKLMEVTSLNNTEQTVTVVNLNNYEDSYDCVYLNSLELAVGDVVLVLFCDNDFRMNLNRRKGNLQTLTKTEQHNHSTNNGVVVGIIYREEE